MKKSLHWVIRIGVVLVTFNWISSKLAYAEDFVSVMEAVQDIPVGKSEKGGFQITQNASFTIAKGERFYSFYTCEPQIQSGVNYGCIKDEKGEDSSCVIRYKGKNYDVATCVWFMDGYERNPHDDDSFRFIMTRPSNSPDLKLNS